MNVLATLIITEADKQAILTFSGCEWDSFCVFGWHLAKFMVVSACILDKISEAGLYIWNQANTHLHFAWNKAE